MRRGRNFDCLSFLAMSLYCALPGYAASCPEGDHDCELVQRFRPYILSSDSGGGTGSLEPYHPATWQWYVQNSSLKEGSKTIVPTASVSWDPPNFMNLVSFSADLAVQAADTGAQLPLNSGDATVTKGVSSSEQAVAGPIAGEDWAFVAQGDGVYGHVERLGLAPPPGQTDSRVVNIDYTIVWSYNESPGSKSITGNHFGDITFLVVLYDPVVDRIVRITYPQHGCALDLYQIPATPMAVVQSIDMLDVTGKTAEHNVISLSIDSAHEADDHRKDCTGGSYTAPASNIMLSADPLDPTSRFEHPLVFAEYGSHESWPNRTGSLVEAGVHDGYGITWMPAFVTKLPAFDAPTNSNKAFLHYNGKFGTDPASLVLHSTWCWPTVSLDPVGTATPQHVSVPCVYTNHRSDGSIINQQDGNLSGFSDMLPYEAKGNLAWPPPREIAAFGDIYVTAAQGQSGSGTQASPYGGLETGMSLAPAGWTIHIPSGKYTGPFMLSRGSTLVAINGEVILGQ